MSKVQVEIALESDAGTELAFIFRELAYAAEHGLLASGRVLHYRDGKAAGKVEVSE